MKNLQNKKNKIIYIGMASILIAITLLAIVVKSFSDERNYSNLYEQAETSMSLGDYENAISCLRRAASIEETEQCLLAMSQCYEKMGNYDKAIELLKGIDDPSYSVQTRISAIENKKKADGEANYITIGGEEYKDNITSLSLDSKILGNSVMQQVAKLYSLNNLSLADNELTDISQLSALGGLTTLNLSNNLIKDISPLSSLTQLRTLYLDKNPIKDLTPLYSLQSLRSLSLKGLELSEDQIEGIKNALPNCAIKGDVSLTEETITLAGVTFDKSAAQVDLSGRGIMDISALAECENLTSINLSNNNITSIKPLMDIPGIARLELGSNAISDIRPLMGLGTIKYLDVSNNAIVSTASLGANTALEDLDLSGNNITNFSGLKKLKNLANLNVANTGFTSDDAKYLTSSKFLSLDIRGCNFNGAEFDKLQEMLPNCAITHDEIIYDFEIAGYMFPSDATEITITNCQISDISGIKSFNNLTKIILSWNAIQDINAFGEMTNKEIVNYIDLSSNQITDLSVLQGFVNLEYLDVSNNMLTTAYSLCSLTNLKELRVGGNLLTDEEIVNLKINLPNCDVIT